MAFEWFLLAAKHGFAQAQFRVGAMLFLGKGVQKDEDTGCKWLNQAAENNNKEAIEFLTEIGKLETKH